MVKTHQSFPSPPTPCHLNHSRQVAGSGDPVWQQAEREEGLLQAQQEVLEQRGQRMRVGAWRDERGPPTSCER